MKIGMFVYNNCTTDVRVAKEAGSLADEGHEVVVVAVLDKKTDVRERRDGFRIIRIDRDPPHYKLLRAVRAVRRGLRLGRGRMRRRARIARSRSLRLTRRGRRGARRILRQRRLRRLALRITRRIDRLTAYFRPDVVLSRVRTRGRHWIVLLAFSPLWVVNELVVRTAKAVGARRAAGRDPLPVPESPKRHIGPLVRRVVGLLGGTGRAVDKAVSRRARAALMFWHKPLMFFDYYRRALRVARDEGFDHVHAHDLITLPVGCLARGALRARLVYDAHELYPEVSTLSRRERWIWARIERTLIPRADSVVTVCDSIADELVARYAVSRPTVLLNAPPYRPLSTEASPLRSAAGLSDEVQIVLYTGGFAPHRGLEALIAAARDFDDGAALVLMGWGTLEAQLCEQVASFGLDGRVRFISPVPLAEVLDYTAGADIGVIPYEPVGLNNTYSTPNKLFDFVAAGIPIVASRLPELARYVEGRGMGVTFKPGSPTDLARAVNDLLRNPEQRNACKQRAQEAATELCWEREEDKLVGLYSPTEAR